MSDEFQKGAHVRVAVDCITGSHLGKQNLRGLEGIVQFVTDEGMITIRFFDALRHLAGLDTHVGTPDAWFKEDELKYLGTPGIDCPYLDDYEQFRKVFPTWPI